MNLVNYRFGKDDLEEYIERMESEEKPVIKKQKKLEKYTEKQDRCQGRIREIKRSQENM